MKSRARLITPSHRDKSTTELMVLALIEPLPYSKKLKGQLSDVSNDRHPAYIAPHTSSNETHCWSLSLSLNEK